MKLIVQIFVGAAVLIGALWLLHVIGAIVGLLFGLLVAAVIGAAVIGLIGSYLKDKRELKGPGPRYEQKLDRLADKELKGLEDRLKGP